MAIRLPSVLDGHRVYRREDWDARPPKRVNSRQRQDVKKNILHYTTGEELGRSDCVRWVQSIQNYHLDTKDWWDIAYNALVCHHGDIFEGRYWDTVGGHTSGHNLEGFGLAFLGDDDPGYNDATEPARAAIKTTFNWSDKQAGRKLERKGHRDSGQTTCPGDELYGWLNAGMPLEATRKPKVEIGIVYESQTDHDQGLILTAYYLFKLMSQREAKELYDVRHAILVGAAAKHGGDYPASTTLSGASRWHTAKAIAKTIEKNPKGSESRTGTPFKEAA